MKSWFYGLGVALMITTAPVYATLDDGFDELSDLSASLTLSGTPSPHPSLQEWGRQLRDSARPPSSAHISPFMQDVQSSMEDLYHRHEESWKQHHDNGHKSPFMASSWAQQDRFNEWESALQNATTLPQQKALLKEMEKAYTLATEGPQPQAMPTLLRPCPVGGARHHYTPEKWEAEANGLGVSPPSQHPEWSPRSPFQGKKQALPPLSPLPSSPPKGF